MTDNPCVYGVELREPPATGGPSATSQYDLLFHPHHHPAPVTYYYDQYYAADGVQSGNLSTALGDIIRENVSLIVDTYNYTAGGGGGTATGGGGTRTGAGDSSFQNQLIIPLYAVIFLLSVVGNLLVILTLAQNKRMRTVTNVYLLNLAISDLLLGVFCMPFTLAGQVLRRFIFGSVMCKLIPYFQAVSVSVAVWTLVAISLERYFAICRPLSSRRWQTQFHAYKMIGLVWTVSFLANSPLCYVQRLQPVLRAGRSTGQMKCREVWPDRVSEKAYVLFHDVGLLVLPLLTMGFAYSMIVSKLWRGLRHEIKHSSLYQQSSKLCQGAAAGVQQSSAVSQNAPGGAYGGNTTPTGGGVKRPDPGSFLHPSSMKKGIFKASQGATVNFSSNSYHNSGSGNGQGAGAGSSAAQGSIGGPDISGHLPTVGNSGDQMVECEYCDTSAGRLRSVRHFFAKHLGSGSPDGLPELAETKFDECHQTPARQQPQQQQQHGYGHHYHHHYNHHHSAPGTTDPADDGALKSDPSYQFSRHAIRSTYMDKSIEAKKKVIRMLFVIIVEFFVCWAPLHILNTVYLYSPSFVYQYVSSSGIALVQLMAYISSCCNPITYCFMNRRFRQAFLAIFSCHRNRMPLCCCICCATQKAAPLDGGEGKSAAYLRQNAVNHSGAERNNSDLSGNDSLVYVGRGIVQRSEILILESEDRV
ncbi:muscarinic acetylcholine receptor M3-like [Anopheles ziemanni]|uniref:muscarinic acetylcholine receptor M3-like n=1 Tax=Anopheles ziemanni TaxID=345580 RepID=UPI00266040F3|nr:muscarinic acetylcholine receptor M3-like [Anopheles ziemanni]